MKDQLNKSFQSLSEKLLGWVNALVENLPNFALAVLVLVLAYFISKYIYKIVLSLVSRRVKQKSISNIIAQISATMMVIAGLFLALGILNLSQALTTLITGAGVIGLVIGLALQGTLSNTISGIVLSFRDKIQIGHWVETNGFAGEILDVNLNNFTLKETDNNVVIIPNKTILESPIKNFSLTPYMRVTISCGVSYKSNLEFVEKLTIDTLNKAFKKIDDSKTVEFYYTEFGDSSINFICRFWISGRRNVDNLKAKNIAIVAIKKAFDANGINIPFPIRTLEFNNKLSLDDPSGNDENNEESK